MDRCGVELSRVTATVHTEHLVALAYINHQLSLHQVGAECYLARIMTAVPEQGIHKDT